MQQVDRVKQHLTDALSSTMRGTDGSSHRRSSRREPLELDADAQYAMQAYKALRSPAVGKQVLLAVVTVFGSFGLQFLCFGDSVGSVRSQAPERWSRYWPC
jgi:hypothetical protein